MDYNYKRRSNDEVHEDYPPHSRLFVVCGRDATADMLQQEFSSFGTIEDIRMPKDHNTGESKGIAYIKFSKTSEAANALEAMDRRTIGNSNRPLKVMVAVNRSEIQDDYDDNRYKRLYIVVAKVDTENTIEDHFSQFGDVESINIQRDRNTGENRGGAYVKFRKFSEAANAYEKCDKKYKALFALPRGFNKRRHETSFESNINNLADTVNVSLISMMKTQPRGYTQVHLMCSPYLSKHHVERIFDLIPGMTYCQYMVDLGRNFGRGTVTYSNPTSASYAVEKLNRFEYPPGCKLFVKPDNSSFAFQEQYFNIPQAMQKLRGAINNTNNSNAPDLAQLAEAISEASKVIKMATAGVADLDIPDTNELSYCSVRLPPPKPLADIDSPVAKRCFLVCKPQPPPLTVLRDVFCRFGDLINVYTLPNKTVGYARYASETAANEAMKTLHGAEVCGVRMKVLEAEEEAPPKRIKYHD